MDAARQIDYAAALIAATNDTTQQAVEISSALSVDPTLATVFPATDLGDQLQQVAKVMKLNLTSPQLSLNRQIFYVETGGYDTHQDQSVDQAGRLGELSQAMAAFYAATIELGIPDRVVTFTLSDFGRTLEPSGDNGSVGSDHGWGSHHFVMGDAVAGGNFYGNAWRQRADLPGSRDRRRGRHLVGRPRPVDSDDVGRTVRRHARPLVRRLGGRSAAGVPADRELLARHARLPDGRKQLLAIYCGPDS